MINICFAGRWIQGYGKSGHSFTLVLYVNEKRSNEVGINFLTRNDHKCQVHASDANIEMLLQFEIFA